MIYFDNAATTALHPEVREAMTEAMELYGNPASIHARGRRSRVFIEDQRINVAALLGVKPGEIFFTSGGTESIQTAITGALKDHGVRRIITTPLEHPAVNRNLESLIKMFPFELVYVNHDKKGKVDLDHLEELFQTEKKTLTILMHANNETGMLLSQKRVAALCRKYNSLFLSDTVQTIGKFEIDLSEGVSFAAASAHKFHGPKGAGILFVDAGTPIEPLILGGGQERNMRSGTENIIGIAGLSKALEVALRDLNENKSFIESLRIELFHGLTQLFPDLYCLTELSHSLYTILNVGIPIETVGEMLVYRLDMEGVAVSGGSACASGANNPSHVLQALGIKPGFEHVRFSFSRYNNSDEIDRFISVIKKMIRK